MPKLYLAPNTISEERWDLLPPYLGGAINHVRLFFVEEEKSARKLLKRLAPNTPLNDCRFLDLNEHTAPKEAAAYINLLKQQDGAIISESGCPCVADPGADLVLLAHEHQIEVVPLVGPSSILLSLMGSGLNGQNFAFNGYLPKDRVQRLRKIKTLEERSSRDNQTQIFMEAPFHNQSLLQDILGTCQDKTRLCIASDLTGANHFIKTMSVQAWKKNPPDLGKHPALFLLQTCFSREK